MRYKNLIFDLDGTLIDSINGIAYSMNKILKENEFPVHDNQIYESFIGNGRRALVKKSLPLSINNLNEIDHFSNEMEINYNKYWDYKMKPYEGIPELLKLLEKENFILNINTNKDSNTAKLVVSKYFAEICFKNIIGQSSNLKKKPDPGGINLILKDLNIPPDNSVYIGDTEVDIMTAQNAGINAILVSWGYRTRKELIDNGATIVVENTEELKSVLLS